MPYWAPGGANAASYDLGTINVDPTTGTFSTFSCCGSTFQVYQLNINIAPLTLNSGDDVTVHLSLSPSLTVPSGNQFVGLNLEPRDGDFGGGPVGNPATNGSMEFQNGSGGPNGAGPFSTSFPLFSNVYGQSGAAFTIVDLLSIATYTWDGGAPLTFNQISLSYQVDNPNPVPVPAALPLFATGLGALGFLARKRRRAAA